MTTKPLLYKPQINNKYELYQYLDTSNVAGMSGKNTGKTIIARDLSLENAEYISLLWLKNMEQND